MDGTSLAFENWWFNLCRSNTEPLGRRKLESFKLFLISADGFLFELGSVTFSNGFDQVQPNLNAIAFTQKLINAGLQLIYLSIRP